MTALRRGTLRRMTTRASTGNSLIAPDYNLAHVQTNFLNEAEHYRVNVFDWDSAFHDVLTGGGFDVVIGNPPYVRPHNILPSDKEYFWRHYTTFVKKSDLYCCFIEKGLRLLKPGGVFGYIVSDGFLRLDSFENLREMLLSETAIQTIIDFTGYVFERANVKTAILLFSKVKPRNNTINVETVDAAADLGGVTHRTITQSAFEKTYYGIPLIGCVLSRCRATSGSGCGRGWRRAGCGVGDSGRPGRPPGRRDRRNSG